VDQILIRVIDMLVVVFSWAVLARVMITWIPIDPYHPIVRLLHEFTDPIIVPIRNIMPTTGMFDFSPIVALFLVRFIAGPLLKTIAGMFSF